MGNARTRGRKRKQGKRTKSGRLSRALVHTYDHGTDRAKAMQEIYGNDGCDAIGRAYRTGLLGEGSDAKAMLDMARRISNTYWAAYQVGAFQSAIADKTGGSTPSISPEDERRREEWMNEQLSLASSHGHAERRLFDALCIDVNPDQGPEWLDRLIEAHKSKAVQINLADARNLQRALVVLSDLADVETPRVATLKAA